MLLRRPPPRFFFWAVVLVGIAIAGVVISIWYYFGVIRAIYWSRDPVDASSIIISLPIRLALYICIAGMLLLGLFPGPMVTATDKAVKVFERHQVTAIANH